MHVTRVAECEEALFKKDTDLVQMTESQKGLTLQISSLEENYDRYTELVRETSLVIQEKIKSETDLMVRTEITQFQKDINILQVRNAALEAQVAALEIRETNSKTQVNLLNQQTQHLELLLFHIKKANAPSKASFFDENLDLNMDMYRLEEVTSRKGSNVSIHLHRTGDGNVFELSPTLPSLGTTEFPSPEITPAPTTQQAPDWSIARLPVLEESQTVLYPKITHILEQNDILASLDKTNLFAEFVYVCDKNMKVAKVIAVNNYRLYVFKDRKACKAEREIPVDCITQIIVSHVCPFVLQIDYQGQKGKEHVVFEIYTAGAFLDFLCTHQGFDASRKRIGNISLVETQNFCNALCNIFKNSRKAGLLERMDTQTSCASWTLVFIVRVENVLSVFMAPQQIVYDKYLDFRRKVLLIRMDNYNVFKDGRNTGYKKENVFYIRIRNEDNDLILSAATPEEKRAWVQSLSE